MNFGWKNENFGLKRSFGNLAKKISGSGNEMIFGPPKPKVKFPPMSVPSNAQTDDFASVFNV